MDEFERRLLEVLENLTRTLSSDKQDIIRACCDSITRLETITSQRYSKLELRIEELEESL